MISISRRSRHPLQPVAGVAALLLVTQFLLPPPVSASCFTSSLPDRYRGEGILPLSLSVDREDLLVTVAWPGEPRSPAVIFVLSAPPAGEIETWPAEQLPGQETEQRLAGALTQVTTTGFQYLLELRDSEGVLGQQLFRVAVSCGDEPCEYRLLPRLESGPIAVSEQFWNAMAAARDSGAADLLASMRAKNPEIAGEIPSFSWQLGQAEPRPGGGCDCRWLAVRRYSPRSFIGDPAGAPPSHESGTNYSGPSFVAGAQARGGAADVERDRTEGAIGVGLQLLCTRDRGGALIEYPTAWPSKPVLEVREPMLASCRTPCTPNIHQIAVFRGCAAGYAVSRQSQRAWSRAEIDAVAILGGQSTVTADALVDLDVSNNQAIGDLDSFLHDSSATVRAEGASISLAASALLEVEAQTPDSDVQPYASAVASLEYAVELAAPAICGTEEGYAAIVHAFPRDDDGGVTMERWEP